jgi:hypothetical protein
MKTKIKLLDWSNGYELPKGIGYRNVAFTVPEYVTRRLFSKSEMSIIDSFDIFVEDLEEARKKYDQYTKKAFKSKWSKLIGKFCC